MNLDLASQENFLLLLFHNEQISLVNSFEKLSEIISYWRRIFLSF